MEAHGKNMRGYLYLDIVSSLPYPGVERQIVYLTTDKCIYYRDSIKWRKIIGDAHLHFVTDGNNLPATGVNVFVDTTNTSSGRIMNFRRIVGSGFITVSVVGNDLVIGCTPPTTTTTTTTTTPAPTTTTTTTTTTPPPPADIGIYAYKDISGSMHSTDVTLDGVQASRMQIANQIILDFDFELFPVNGVGGASVWLVANAIKQFIETHCDKAHNNRLIYIVFNDSSDSGTTTWAEIETARNNSCSGIDLHVFFLRIHGSVFGGTPKTQLEDFIATKPSWVKTFFFDDYNSYNTGGEGSSIATQINQILSM